jgi:hypothetical protein
MPTCCPFFVFVGNLMAARAAAFLREYAISEGKAVSFVDIVFKISIIKTTKGYAKKSRKYIFEERK